MHLFIICSTDNMLSHSDMLLLSVTVAEKKGEDFFGHRSARVLGNKKADPLIVFANI